MIEIPVLAGISAPLAMVGGAFGRDAAAPPAFLAAYGNSPKTPLTNVRGSVDSVPF